MYTSPYSAQKDIEAFFDVLRPIAKGYQDEQFTFVAINHLGVFTIVQSRLLINIDAKINTFHFKTDRILAGRFSIRELGLSAEDFLGRAVIGSVPTPIGEIRFPSGEAGRYAAHFEPFHPEGLAAQQRLNVLRLDGATVDGYVNVTDLDWHLRGALEPYDSLGDLISSLGLGTVREHLNIEVVASQITVIDSDSYVLDTEAHIGVRLANSLDPANTTLGYRVIHQGNTITRTSVSGCDLAWNRLPDFQIGKIKIKVPTAAAIQCFASFNGVAQHFYWLADPTTSQNPRRTAYEAFDSGLSILTDFLTRQGKGQNARDLEVGVSWLLWLLCFSTVNLGSTAKTQDFADLIATTPKGNFVVIECTTGLLKSDNKLSLLVQRTQLVRERIIHSGNQHLKVLPALVTSKSRDEVLADIEQAERLGIVVVTKETLEADIVRTLIISNADEIFAEGEGLVRRNLDHYGL